MFALYSYDAGVVLRCGGVRMDGAVGRRVHTFRGVEEKRRIVEETLRDGASVSSVARAHGVNANQVFQWRRLYRDGLYALVPRNLWISCRKSVRVVTIHSDAGMTKSSGTLRVIRNTYVVRIIC